MAQNRSGARQASSSFERERLRVLRELEDAPMNQVNVREGLETESDACPGTWQEELLGLLEDQNHLLYDILGALNALVAAQLARNQQ